MIEQNIALEQLQKAALPSGWRTAFSSGAGLNPVLQLGCPYASNLILCCPILNNGEKDRPFVRRPVPGVDGQHPAGAPQLLVDQNIPLALIVGQIDDARFSLDYLCCSVLLVVNQG